MVKVRINEPPSLRVFLLASNTSENINNYEIAFAQALENAGISAYKYDNNSNPPKIQITARYEVRVQPCGAGPSERSSPTLTNLLT